MHPVRYFSILYEAACNRLIRLRNLADTASSRPASEFKSTNLELSFVAIELHTAIANFTRAYFLSCTLLPVTVTGAKVICHFAIANYSDAIDASMKACKYTAWAKARGMKNWDRRDEPPWHQPGTLIRSCQEIGCSHQSKILAAYSVPTQVFDHLTKVRNFYAHRNQYTISAARSIATSYSISTMEHPSQILRTPAYGRPQPIIMDWIDDARNVIDLLCQ
jgi:hypothetical protein